MNMWKWTNYILYMFIISVLTLFPTVLMYEISCIRFYVNGFVEMIQLLLSSWYWPQMVTDFSGLCHRFCDRWSQIFQASSFQLRKLENLLRWSFFTFIYNHSSKMNYFIYFTSQMVLFVCSIFSFHIVSLLLCSPLSKIF